jgi:hypothetical protein
MFEDQPEEVRPGLIRAHTLVTYGKRFDNLFLQESRLNRRYDKLMRELCELKRRRIIEEQQRQAAARVAATRSPERTGPNGFEFSTRNNIPWVTASESPSTEEESAEPPPAEIPEEKSAA